MRIFTKKTHLTKTIQLGILWLFLAAVTGCGNKGDLYHPSEQPDNQAVSQTAVIMGDENHVSL